MTEISDIDKDYSEVWFLFICCWVAFLCVIQTLGRSVSLEKVNNHFWERYSDYWLGITNTDIKDHVVTGLLSLQQRGWNCERIG